MSNTVLENERFLMEVNSKGAELRRLYDKTNNREVLWNADEQFWGRVSPILFPVIGMVNNDNLTFDGKQYPMTKHGIVRDSKFELVEKTAEKVTYLLKSDEESKRYFPYDFELLVSYLLSEQGVKTEWKVKNPGDREMLFSIGGHPAFAIPHCNNEELHEYTLGLHGKDRITEYQLHPPYISGETSITNPGSLVMDAKLFKEDTLVYSGLDKITLNKGERSMSVVFEGFPYVAIWAPVYENGTRTAPFVCIEPWFGIADYETTDGSAEGKAGMQRLCAGGAFETSYQIQL